jgi:hypothetical protein
VDKPRSGKAEIVCHGGSVTLSWVTENAQRKRFMPSGILICQIDKINIIAGFLFENAKPLLFTFEVFHPAKFVRVFASTKTGV